MNRSWLATGKRDRMPVADAPSTHAAGRDVARTAKMPAGGRGVSFGLRSADWPYRFWPRRRRRDAGTPRSERMGTDENDETGRMCVAAGRRGRWRVRAIHIAAADAHGGSPGTGVEAASYRPRLANSPSFRKTRRRSCIAPRRRARPPPARAATITRPWNRASPRGRTRSIATRTHTTELDFACPAPDVPPAIAHGAHRRVVRRYTPPRADGQTLKRFSVYAR